MEEYEQKLYDSVFAYMIREASPSEEAAKKHRNRKARSATGLQYVEFVSYDKGMARVKAEERPYIVELSEPWEG